MGGERGGRSNGQSFLTPAKEEREKVTTNETGWLQKGGKKEEVSVSKPQWGQEKYMAVLKDMFRLCDTVVQPCGVTWTRGRIGYMYCIHQE